MKFTTETYTGDRCLKMKLSKEIPEKASKITTAEIIHTTLVPCSENVQFV